MKEKTLSELVNEAWDSQILNYPKTSNISPMTVDKYEIYIRTFHDGKKNRRFVAMMEEWTKELLVCVY